VSYHESKLIKLANFSVLPAQVQNRAGQGYRVPGIHIPTVGCKQNFHKDNCNINSLERKTIAHVLMCRYQPDNRPTLTGTSIAEADGSAVMEFAKLLVDQGAENR
jgi:hypothetical protein